MMWLYSATSRITSATHWMALRASTMLRILSSSKEELRKDESTYMHMEHFLRSSNKLLYNLSTETASSWVKAVRKG
eukprot:158097-Amphidinium_carterae.1